MNFIPSCISYSAVVNLFLITQFIDTKKKEGKGGRKNANNQDFSVYENEVENYQIQRKYMIRERKNIF